MTQLEVAKKFKCSRSNISEIATGRAWTKVEGPEKANTRKTPVKDYDPTDERVLQLESELSLIRKERQQARKQYEASKHERGLFNAVVKEMETRIQPLKAINKVPVGRRKAGVVTESLVLHLSDGHHDEIVDPVNCGGLEAHDFPTAVRRAERYVDRVLKYTQGVLGNAYTFPEVYVLAYGDHTSGEIHGAVQRSQFKNQFNNSLAIGQMHALMYKELAEYFPKVHVVYVPGNHGRRTNKKDYHGAQDNWDYLVGKVAELHCSQIDGIDFNIPDAFCVNLAINGVGFSVFHGDDIKSAMGIPWYGLERRTRRVQAMTQAAGLPRVRYQCCGHFHKPAAIGDLDGELIVNGPWVATNAYSYNAFAGFTEPSQWMHGVDPDHGISWRMNVHVRNQKKYLETPTRYKIPFINEIA